MEHPWRTALVTGASSGIGAAIAEQVGATGVDLVLVARRRDRLEELAERIIARAPGSGPDIEVLSSDLSDRRDRSEVAERLADRSRPIDLLVNNAGLGAATSFAEGDQDRYDQMLAVNIATVVELSKAAIPPMLDRGRGWVLNVSSLGGHAPGPGFAVYSATKAFVTSFSESLHEEYRTRGVVVTAMCPGATHTEFGESGGADGDDLPGWLWQEASEVAEEGLAAAAGGRAVRVTGMPNRLAAGLTALLPRAARRRVAGQVAGRL